METKSEETPRKSRIAAGLVFLMHQVIATAIVYMTAQLVLAFAADLLWPFGVRLHKSAFTLISPPYFPLQIIWALFLGWSLSGYLRYRSMLWVWVVPTVMFSAGFVCLDVGSNWRLIAHTRLTQTWIWIELAVGLWALTMMFAVSTYIFMVVISLIGRRFSLTRCFLNQGPPAVDGEMKVPA
jgi:hypothetical protein